MTDNTVEAADVTLTPEQIAALKDGKSVAVQSELIVAEGPSA